MREGPDDESGPFALRPGALTRRRQVTLRPISDTSLKSYRREAGVLRRGGIIMIAFLARACGKV